MNHGIGGAFHRLILVYCHSLQIVPMPHAKLKQLNENYRIVYPVARFVVGVGFDALSSATLVGSGSGSGSSSCPS